MGGRTRAGYSPAPSRIKLYLSSFIFNHTYLFTSFCPLRVGGAPGQAQTAFYLFLPQSYLYFNLFFCTARGAHKRCSMSTPLVNHRPLKGKEDGIFIIAYTSTRTNPANRYWSENSTATSLILPLKNPLLASRAAFTLTYPHPFSILFFEPMWEKLPHLLPLHYYLLPQLITCR